MALQAYASDNFTTGGRGAPNAWSPASDPKGGVAWAQPAGAAAMSLTTIASKQRGQVTNDTANNLFTLGALAMTDVDQYVEISASDLNVKMGLISRYTSANNYYRCDWANGNLEIFTQINGTGTVIKTQAISGFTPATGTFYTLHFRTQGFGVTGSNPNNLMANIFPAGGPEPTGWMIQASDSNLFIEGTYGFYYKATLATQSATFDSYTVTDCPAPTIAPAYNTPALRPYGATMYVPNTNTPPLPSQTIVDMIGTCALGTNSARATGLNKGSVLRYQMRWKNVEVDQINGTSYYDWANMDDAVAKANYWGFGLMWPVQAPPTWQQTRDALGSACTLTAAPGGGGNYIAGTAYSSINVTALPNGAFIPHKSKLAINWSKGGVGQENVYVWDNVPKVYQQGATSINISSSATTFVAWTPASTHVVGEVVWEATNNGTGGPCWAKSSAYVTMCTLVATRYNGQAGSFGKLDILQVENEDYDTSNRIGGQGAFGANGNSPGATDSTYTWDGSSTWDNGGAILANVYVNVRNAVKGVAGMRSLPIFPCSVRKTPNTARQHIINWVTGFVVTVLKNGGTVDGIDFHSYRDGTFTVNADGSLSLITDPAISTYMDANHVTVNAPSISLEVADIKAVCAASSLNPQIMCGENGWPIYDDGNGPQALLTAARTPGGGPYTTLLVGTWSTNGTGAIPNIPKGTAITVDYPNAGSPSEIVYCFTTTTSGAASIPITTDPTAATQTGWTPANTHAIGAVIYGSTTTVPITTAQQATYYKEMYDGMRLGGADYCFCYTMDSIASNVHSGFNPVWSGRPDGITQIIGGVYTYEPAYITTGNDSDTFSSWKAGGPPPPPPATTGVLLPAIARRDGTLTLTVARRDGSVPFTKRRG